MKDIRGKRVLVVGLARSGQAAALCLNRRGALVTVTDLKPPSEFRALIPELSRQKIGLELGLHRTDTFLRQDLIVVSPGVPWDAPPLVAARRANIPVFPEIEAASWFLRARVAGITGTNGKSTTTALLGEMLEASGFPTFVGGNIGVPLISAVDKVKPDSLVVAEVSSYQLEAIQEFRPHVAVLLNVTPHHLDRHPSTESYLRAKAMIFRNQTPEDYAILNADDAAVMSLAPEIPSRKVLFSRRQDLPDGIFVSDGEIRYRVGHLERALVDTHYVSLRGDFNLENVMAAAAAACVLGADFEALAKAVRGFRSLPHRLEYVREIRGVKFYNDSKATSVDATTKALSVFERGVHLILGGKDEGASYEPLRRWLERRVRSVYLIGASAERMKRELEGAAEFIQAGELKTAVERAFDAADPGDVILLAPACPSFDQFHNFEDRGDAFKEIVERLARETKAAEVARRESEVGSATPIPEPRTPSPDMVTMYEVTVEEVTPLEVSGLTESAVKQPEPLDPDSARAAEGLDDEALPFEVRATLKGAADGPEDGSPSASAVAPKVGGNEAAKTPLEESNDDGQPQASKPQRRLPGI